MTVIFIPSEPPAFAYFGHAVAATDSLKKTFSRNFESPYSMVPESKLPLNRKVNIYSIGHAKPWSVFPLAVV
jgi:hypothetical protein